MAPRREDRLRRRGRRATILGVGPVLLGLLALVSSNLLVWGWTVGPGKGGVAGAVHQDDKATPRRRPIILVPGLAASKLEVKVDERYEFPEGCEGSGEPGRWELNWMNLNSVLKIKCFGDKLRLVYGRREVHDGPLRRALRLVFGPARREEVVPVDRIGVEVRPRDFGGLGGVTSMLHAFGTTFAVDKMTNFVRGLQRLGWVEGENLYGAPFDWRYAPSRSGATAFQNFDRDLTALVEEAVQKTGLRAVLLGHSLGGLMLTNFLSRKQRAWKEKHVEAFVPMSVPFGGAARSIKSILIGGKFRSKANASTLISDVAFLPRRQRQRPVSADGLLRRPSANLHLGPVAPSQAKGLWRGACSLPRGRKELHGVHGWGAAVRHRPRGPEGGPRAGDRPAGHVARSREGGSRRPYTLRHQQRGEDAFQPCPRLPRGGPSGQPTRGLVHDRGGGRRGWDREPLVAAAVRAIR